MKQKIINNKVYYVDSRGEAHATRAACIEAEAGYK